MDPDFILQKYKGGYVCLDSLADYLWISVEYFPMECLNGLFVEGKDRSYIAINAVLPDEYKRFTLAHEIWHFLYWDRGFSTSMMAKYDSREKRADDFARKILMPEELLKEEIDKWVSMFELAQIFCVPFDQLEIRIKDVL